MAIDLTLFVWVNVTNSEDVRIRLVNISGLSILEAETLADVIDRSISKTEYATLSRITWRLIHDFPGVSWGITIQYSDGRDNGHLFYKTPGGVPTQAPKEPPPEPQRVSRYTRIPVI